MASNAFRAFLMSCPQLLAAFLEFFVMRCCALSAKKQYSTRFCKAARQCSTYTHCAHKCFLQFRSADGARRMARLCAEHILPSVCQGYRPAQARAVLGMSHRLLPSYASRLSFAALTLVRSQSSSLCPHSSPARPTCKSLPVRYCASFCPLTTTSSSSELLAHRLGFFCFSFSLLPI